MKTIQMTIDEPLLVEVDRVSQALKTNRSEFIREALKLALQRQKILELERRHADGYAGTLCNRMSSRLRSPIWCGVTHEAG